jgi:hypothetical protein
MADALGSLVISLIADTAVFRSELDKATTLLDSSARQMQASMTSLQGSFKETTESFRRLAEFTAVGLSVHGIVEWSKGVVEATSS